METEVVADSSSVLAVWLLICEREPPGRVWLRARREAARLLRGSQDS